MLIHSSLAMSASYILTAMLVCTLLTQCAPVFSELQSARTLVPANIEYTPVMSFVTERVPDPDSLSSLMPDMYSSFAIGITENFDLRARLDISLFGGGDDIETDSEIIGFRGFSLGGKVAIIPERVSAYFPIAWGDYTEERKAWQLQPSIIISQQINPRLEFTIAPKAVFGLCNACGSFIGINLGLSIASRSRPLSLRIEYGLLTQLDSDRSYRHLSFGLSRSWDIGKAMKDQPLEHGPF